jgi:hypothetical protein
MSRLRDEPKAKCSSHRVPSGDFVGIGQRRTASLSLPYGSAYVCGRTTSAAARRNEQLSQRYSSTFLAITRFMREIVVIKRSSRNRREARLRC